MISSFCVLELSLLRREKSYKINLILCPFKAKSIILKVYKLSSKFSVYLFVIILSALTFLAGCGVTKPVNVKSETSLKSLEYQLLDLVNKERKKAGLRLYVMDADLQIVARKHSADMVKRNYFSHTNLKGESPFDRLKNAKIKYTKAAENLAEHISVQEIHKSLMNSPGHRKNIMNPQLGKLGIGIVNSKNGLMATQVFKNPD